jgi:hypothetical protein
VLLCRGENPYRDATRVTRSDAPPHGRVSRKTSSVNSTGDGDNRHTAPVPGLLIGYARCSTDAQDLTAQRDALAGLGLEPKRIYVDHGRTGTNRARPGLREALSACRAGDTLVVTKLDRLARSVPDARAIADELTAGPIKLSIGGSVHDPTDPVGRLLFNALAMIAEFSVISTRRVPELPALGVVA